MYPNDGRKVEMSLITLEPNPVELESLLKNFYSLDLSRIKLEDYIEKNLTEVDHNTTMERLMNNFSRIFYKKIFKQVKKGFSNSEKYESLVKEISVAEEKDKKRLHKKIYKMLDESLYTEVVLNNIPELVEQLLEALIDTGESEMLSGISEAEKINVIFKLVIKITTKMFPISNDDVSENMLDYLIMDTYLHLKNLNADVKNKGHISKKQLIIGNTPKDKDSKKE